LLWDLHAGAEIVDDMVAGSFAIRQSKTILGAILARDRRFDSFPRANSLLKTRRETRTVRFIGVCRCVDIRQIDSAGSNVCFAVRVCRVSRQESVGR